LNLKGKDLKFNQVIINKYEPGQGISKHTDAKDYGPIIGCYTIESGATMKFNKDKDSVSIYTKPNSLYIMSGDSRYKWTHEMTSTKSDNVDGKRVPRTRRISITFRHVPVDEENESDDDKETSLTESELREIGLGDESEDESEDDESDDDESDDDESDDDESDDDESELEEEIVVKKKSRKFEKE
jgi:hypothetical protein